MDLEAKTAAGLKEKSKQYISMSIEFVSPYLKKLSHSIDAHPARARWILAGPLTLIVSILTMMVMPLWFPVGNGGINHLALPVLLFPINWAFFFFFSILTNNLPRTVFIFSGLTVVQFLIVLIRV